jgi:hypothetical protein
MPSRHPSYAWQSNDSFLQFEAYPLCGMKEVNLRTGTKNSLDRLERRLGNVAAYRRFVVAPDGTRALWEDKVEDRPGVCSTLLDPSAPVDSDRMSDRFWAVASNPLWLPDNRRWIQLFAGHHGLSAVVHEQGKVAPDREIKIGVPNGTSSGYDPMQAHLLGCTQPGYVLATPASVDHYENPAPTRHIDFFAFGRDTIRPKVHEYTIDLPTAEMGYDHNVALARDEEIELSPYGDRIAWLVHRRIEFPAPRWFSRWLPGKMTTPRLFTELRITNLDGTGSRTVGMIEFHEISRTGLWQSKSPSSEERPFGMHWMPDGRHISFIFHGSLRVVPTD